jgi:hypothetical protein
VFFPVIKHVFNAVVAVNNERADELLQITKGARLVLLLSDEFKCFYDGTAGEIVISTAAIESMWAACYGYYAAHKIAKQRNAEDDQAKSVSDEDLALALEVYRWSLQRVHDKPAPPWPSTFPVPEDPEFGQTTKEATASEYALVAMAFLLLHEVGHHALLHEPGADQVTSFQMERDADNFALDWMMDGEDKSERSREKLRTGIAMACGWMVAHEAILWRQSASIAEAKRRHPRSYARLFDLLDRADAGPGATSWEVVVAILSLHVRHVGLPIPCGQYPTARDAVDTLTNVLAEAISK